MVSQLAAIDERGREEKRSRLSAPADATKEEGLRPLLPHEPGAERNRCAVKRLGESGNPLDLTGDDCEMGNRWWRSASWPAGILAASLKVKDVQHHA
jgi:hypothetical protein